jgi:hypothetical protein
MQDSCNELSLFFKYSLYAVGIIVISNTAIMTTSSSLPIIKINYDHQIIDANLNALPILANWCCTNGSTIPEGIMSKIPSLEIAMKTNTERECKLKFGDTVISFDIIPFMEGGYIGLYGYKAEQVEVAIYKGLRVAV